MSSAVIGNLRANLGLNTAQFSSGLEKSRNRLKAWGKALKMAAAAAVAGLAAAVSGLAVAVKRTIDEADQMSKLSQAIGVTVGELSTLRHAAELSGITFESLTKGMTKLAKSMSDSLRTPTSEQALAFKALGISVTDASGKMKSTTVVLNEIADRFEKTRDGTNKTNLALATLGKSGPTWIPMLNRGSAGLREMTDEAKALGLQLSTDTARRAEEFNDTILRIRRVFTGIVTKITADLLPALQNIATAFFDAAKDGSNLKAVTNAVRFVFRSLAQAGLEVVVVLKEIQIWSAAIGKATKEALGGDLSKAYNTLKNGHKLVEEAWKAHAERVKKIWSNAKTDLKEPLDAGTVKPAAPNLVGNEAQKKAREDAAKALEELKRQGQAVFEATRTPLELLQAEIQRLNMMLNKGVISWETYSRAMVQAQEQFEASRAGLGELGELFEDKAVGEFDKFIDGTLRMRDALKSLASDLLKFFANQAIRNVFSSLAGAGGGGTGSVLGSIFGGFRADGGSVMAGKSYLVGEQGPELFNPGMAGNIIPNHQLEDGGPSVMINSPISIDARGSDLSRAELVQHLKTALDARDADLHRQILDLKQRGAI